MSELVPSVRRLGLYPFARDASYLTAAGISGADLDLLSVDDVLELIDGVNALDVLRQFGDDEVYVSKDEGVRLIAVVGKDLFTQRFGVS